MTWSWPTPCWFPGTTADNAERRCCECHEEELRVEVVYHEEPASQHRERHEEVENEGLIAGRLFMSIRKWPWGSATKSLREG